MKKDVLVMCQYFYPEYVSTATLPTNIAEKLVEKGMSVDVICGLGSEYGTDRNLPRFEEYKGIGIYRVPYTQLDKKSSVGRIVNFFSFFVSNLIRLPKLLKYKSILVYSNPPILPFIPYIISKVTSTKFIFVAFDVYPDSAVKVAAISEGGIIAKMMKFVNRRVYKNATKIVVLGSEMKERMVRKNNLQPDIIDVIPNWSEPHFEVDYKVKNAEFSGLKESWPFIVLYSGNMGSAQDMETITDCLLSMKDEIDIFFAFTGHGNKSENIKKIISENKIKNASVYGFLQGDDYKDMLHISDICLVSLAEGIEGLGVPSKTYSYFSAGKPVVSIMSKNTDIARVIEQYDAGYCVEQGEHEKLKQILNNCKQNIKSTKQMGENAKVLFEELYTKDIGTEKYFELISNIIQFE